ncbi:MAG: nitronate monooxygenase [Candidatus Cloacimonadota bacterium]|nr:nitronate monooxygenase [Candidatus Cloacimonadota bacterium]
MKLPKLHIGNFVADKPIIQGGMGVGVSMANLASAVANQGGIGVLSSVALGMIHPEKGQNYREANREGLRYEIREARKLSDGIIGINVMVAITDFDDIVKVAIDENIDIIFMGAGLPLKVPKTVSFDKFFNSGTKLGVIVSSSRAARLIFKSWGRKFNYIPDIVVVEGPKAGGHLGFALDEIDDPNFALEKILPEVISVVDRYEKEYNKNVPVIAAGGIFDGKDIYKMMKLGASGVQIGTRFVATEECGVDQSFKDAYISAKKDDIQIIESPVGLPGRAISNKFLSDVAQGVRPDFKCNWKCLKTCDYKTAPYCIADALTNAKNGDLDNGFAFAGTNAYRVNEIVSVKQLFTTLINEFEQAQELA